MSSDRYDDTDDKDEGGRAGVACASPSLSDAAADTGADANADTEDGFDAGADAACASTAVLFTFNRDGNGGGRRPYSAHGFAPKFAAGSTAFRTPG